MVPQQRAPCWTDERVLDGNESDVVSESAPKVETGMTSVNIVAVAGETLIAATDDES